MRQAFIKYYLILIGLVFFSCSATANSANHLNALLHQKDDPVIGNPHGKITIVEFFDYQCAHCIHMASVIESIIKDNPQVRVVLKEFPIRDAMSDFAARAALAANQAGKYQAFSHALFHSSQPLNQASVFTAAQQAGLDPKQIKQMMNSESIFKQINNNRHLANQLQLNATPAFFIGKTDTKDFNQLHFILGAMSQSELQEVINQIAG